jgi:hypothetical protein
MHCVSRCRFELNPAAGELQEKVDGVIDQLCDFESAEGGWMAETDIVKEGSHGSHPTGPHATLPDPCTSHATDSAMCIVRASLQEGDQLRLIHIKKGTCRRECRTMQKT